MVDRNAISRSRPGVKPIVVVGGGGHARVLIRILLKLRRYRILGYTALQRAGSVTGIPYLGSDQRIADLKHNGDKLSVVLAVGQLGLGDVRFAIWKRLQLLGVLFPPIVSPDAIVNDGVTIGEGTVVMDGTVISTGATIGRGAIVNTNSTVEHDVALGDWVHVAPGATICGGVTVGAYSLIGAGATVIEGKKIESGCLIGAGAVVIKDLTEVGVYVGCPARRIR